MRSDRNLELSSPFISNTHGSNTGGVCCLLVVFVNLSLLIYVILDYTENPEYLELNQSATKKISSGRWSVVNIIVSSYNDVKSDL